MNKIILGITFQDSDKHGRQLMRPNLALQRGNYKNAPRSVDLVSYDQVMCLLSEFGTLYMYNKPFLSSSKIEDKMTYSNISVLGRKI